MGIGAIIHNWIPESWIQAVLGSNNPFGVFLAVLVGVPMYADIFGTIPVAEALLAKGAQLGTILSFMMAVTTLSLQRADNLIFCKDNPVTLCQSGGFQIHAAGISDKFFHILLHAEAEDIDCLCGSRRAVV